MHLIRLPFVVLLAWQFTVVSSFAQQPPAAANSQDAFQALLTDLVREALPEEYEDTKHWGQTKQVWDGLKVSRDGWQVKTKRRHKEVNHGSWRRYRVTPIDPARELHVELANVRTRDDGRLAFDAICTAKVRAEARLSQWQLGVQLASISAEADAKVRLTLEMAVAFEFRREGLLPEVIVTPEATAADIDLVDFRLERISKLDGPLVKELGESLEGTVARRLEAKRGKIVEKVNQQIKKHPDQLRLSLTDFAASRWSEIRDAVSP